MTRSRNKDGTWRLKRVDTLVRNIEEKYNVDLNMRGDAHLETALVRYHAGSVKELVEKARKRNKRHR